MPNPILPLWEYIPDGEPRVFGDRVYLYGSHDRAASEDFCDFKLKVWSAPLSDLNHWQCHGHSFHTAPDADHPADTDWTQRELYAPDVVCRDGKYYLYAYILNSKGCVGVSDAPEGPFRLLSTYAYAPEDAGDDGIFNDAGVLVDDDGRVYIYYGFERQFFGEIDPATMYTIKPGSLKADLIPQGMQPTDFFEASSPRKIGDRYYLIYSPRRGHCLDYAIADRPEGPFVRMGTIVDNGADYPAGNNHGSICCLHGQWYVFYHRMTNNSIMSRRACVERITILEDGTIPQVEMTSLGFEESLDPYHITPAEIACVLKGGCMITEKDVFTRTVTELRTGCVVGYKYFDFGEDASATSMTFCVQVTGCGCRSKLHILIDGEDGEEIGVCPIDTHDGTYRVRVKSVTGRHSVFFKVEHDYHGWWADHWDGRHLFDLHAFVFMK